MKLNDRSWCGLICAVFVCFALIGTCRPIVASPKSLTLVKQGNEALEREDAEEALRYFEQAAASDSEDAQAVFFQGIALNRQTRYQEALQRLLRSERMGSKNPALDHVIGCTLVGLQQYERAVPRLERYEQNHPANAANSFLLGRALVALGRLDDAEAYLHEAIGLDSSIEPAARAYLSVAAEQRGDYAAAEGHLSSLLLPSATDPVSQRVQQMWDELDALVVEEDYSYQRPWEAYLTMGGGYNSNVPLLPGLFISPGPGGGGSAFGLFALGVNLDVFCDDNHALGAGYRFDSNEYESQLNFGDAGDHYLYANYSHALSDNLQATLLVDDRYILFHDDSFRNRVTVRPGVLYRATDNVLLAFQYEYANDNFFGFSTPASNRDGSQHNLVVAAQYQDPCTETILVAGYYHMFNVSEGSDFDFQSDALFVSALKTLPWRTVAQLRYLTGSIDFENPSSLTGFATPRDDEISLFSVMLTKAIDLPRLAPNASIYLRFDYWNDDSNILLFDYDLKVVGGGLTLEY